MNRNRLLAILAALPLAIAPAAASATEDTTLETTSDSSSEATAVEVEGVVTVSSTSADTSGDGSAEATSAAVFDQTVVGGAQEGEGSSSGELMTTGENDQGHLDVAPWQAEVDEDGNASSRAALADGNLGGEEGISLVLLESRSDAQHDGSTAESTGAYLDLGGNEFRVLYAETSSEGSGESYLLDLAGERIGTNEDFDGNCAIPADPLANINCLQADEISGDALPEGADSGGEAFVGDVEVLDGALTGDIVSGTATQGSAPAGSDDVSAAPAPAPDDDQPGSGNLPRTGASLLAMIAGLGAMGSGEALRRWKRL